MSTYEVSQHVQMHSIRIPESTKGPGLLSLRKTPTISGPVEGGRLEVHPLFPSRKMLRAAHNVELV